MALTRYGNVVYNQYNDTVEVDPGILGNPTPGNLFNGAYNGLLWTKNSDGDIWYSGAQLQTVIDVTSATFTNQSDWLGKLIKWDATQDGLLTLDNLDGVFSFVLYDNCLNLNNKIMEL